MSTIYTYDFYFLFLFFYECVRSFYTSLKSILMKKILMKILYETMNDNDSYGHDWKSMMMYLDY